jgi:hypothetical protein
MKELTVSKGCLLGNHGEYQCPLPPNESRVAILNFGYVTAGKVETKSKKEKYLLSFDTRERAPPCNSNALEL